AVFPSPGRLDRLAHGIVYLVEPPESRERKGERSHKLRVGEPPAGLIAGVEGFTKDGQALRELVAFDQQLAAQELSDRGPERRGRALCRLDDAGDRGFGGGEIACHRGDPAHTVKEHPTHRQLVIVASYLAEARLRLWMGPSRKSLEPEGPSQQGPGHRAVVRMPPGWQPVLVLVKRRRLDDALKVAPRLCQPTNPEQYHSRTPIGEHDARRVADLLGYCAGTLGRC